MLIEQLPIAATPKYNFPQIHHETLFPQEFLELSIRSIKSKNPNPQLSVAQLNEENLDNLLLNTVTKKLTVHSYHLKPSLEETTVIGIDVSSIKIGETPGGSLIALRGVVVYKQKSKYRYIRLGPFPLHVTEENKHEIFCLLSRNSFVHTQSGISFSLRSGLHNGLTIDANLTVLQTRVTSLFEDCLQKNLAETTYNSLILFDGSLTVKAGDSFAFMKERILETAKKNNNSVLAFSKATRLRLRGRLLTDIVWKNQPPSLLEIQNMPERIGAVQFLGNIYVARLRDKENTYRLDIYKEIPQQQCVDAVQRLMGNDSLVHGYPETLRLAHILSTFTANEVLGIQRYLAKHYGLKIMSRQNVRKMLFGPYGTGVEE